MGNNRRMTTLIAVGGLLLGAMQFMRNRSRPSGTNRVWHELGNAWEAMQSGSSRLVQQSQRMYRRARRRIV